MSAFGTVIIEAMRLCILQILAVAPEYACNSQILVDVLERHKGLHVTHDQVRAELAWLKQLGLITLIKLSPEISVATLTERGSDVGKGRATIPGVERPIAGAS